MLDSSSCRGTTAASASTRTPAASRTASKYQVRQPVYVSSVGRWKHYECHLGELIAALGGPAARMA